MDLVSDTKERKNNPDINVIEIYNESDGGSEIDSKYNILLSLSLMFDSYLKSQLC